MEATRILDLFGDERNVDPFRLAILGFASIEDTLNEALEDAFDGALPGELRRTPFKARLALAVAMNLFPATVKGPLGRIADVRHQFAHGRSDPLTEAEGRQFYSACRELAPELDQEVPSLRDERQPEIHLTNLLLLAEVIMVASNEQSQERRAHQQEAIREWWRQRGLSRDEVKRLLADDAAVGESRTANRD